MKEVYLDNGASTPIDPRAAVAVLRAQREAGNPSSFNDAGRRAARLLAASRVGVARFINARADEVVFCASGSEANTLALLGVAHTATGRRLHIVSTPIEHLSVLAAIRRLGRQGWDVSEVRVDDAGRVAAADIAELLTTKTRLVSVMYANNEVGTVQPIKAVARAIREWRRAKQTKYPYLHVDACQAAAWLPMDVQALGADLVTFNGAKVYGPRGTGVLFVRRGIELEAQVMGGDQEGGRRAGTEDIAGAAGLHAAVASIRRSDSVRTARLRDRLIAGIRAGVPEVRLNGPTGRDRLAGNVHVSIPGCSSEMLLLELDRHGIRAGSGSACTAHRVEPSHVLRAMHVPQRYLAGALRFSLSRKTTLRDVEQLIRALPKAVNAVRTRSLK